MNVDMKKSLITRFLLIAVIMLAWGSSLFPLRDRPFMDVFQSMSASQMAKYKQQLDQATAGKDEAKAAGLKKILADYETLAKRMTALNDDYKAQHNGDEMAPQRLLVTAARGAGGPGDHIQLRDFFTKFAGRSDFSNNEVIRHVRAASRGRLRKGLDLQGGVEFIVSFQKLPESNETEDRIRDQVRDIIERRVNEQGLADAAVVAIQGSPKISVTLPAVSEADKADIRSLILMPAKLEFYRVHEDDYRLINEYKANPAEFKVPKDYWLTTIDSEKDGIITSEPILLQLHVDPSNEASILSGKGIGSSATRGVPMVESARAASDPIKNYVVHIKFTTAGAGSFGRLTTEMQPVQVSGGLKHFRLAIVLDGKVYSAPSINEPITGGNCEISGSFTREEAKILADAVASGNLPAKLKIDSEFGTTASLGADTVRQGFIATIISCLAVYSFLIYYYRLCGVISVIALSANLLLTLGTMALLGASITMPGVAGLVLGLGMSVDANVLIYERMREELNKGKSLGNALRYGYDRAFWPIFDSNLTTIITALVLYKYGSGAIRGFAITLAFGVAASMFTALTMTRFIFDYLMYNNWLDKVSMEGWLSKRMNLHVMRIAFPCFMVSLVMAISSIGIGVYRGAVSKDVFSIDFAGGIKIGYDVNEAKCPGGKRPSPDELQKLILDNKGLFGDYDVSGAKQPGYKTNVAGGKLGLDIILPNYEVKAIGSKAKPGTAAKVAGKVEVVTPATVLDGILEKNYPGAFVQSSYNQIGDLVGKDFRWKALFSLFLASLATIGYLAFRFELPYGIAAVVACIHDVIIAGGIYLATGGQLSLTVLAALLTILGWSLNDTIVIFDRIREELNTYPNKPYVSIVEDSVNDMFGRTLLVTASTLLGTLVLVIFGGPALWEFSVVMLYGIFIGSYSTIYIASYMVIHWHKRVRGHKDTIPTAAPVVKS